MQTNEDNRASRRDRVLERKAQLRLIEYIKLTGCHKEVPLQTHVFLNSLIEKIDKGLYV